MIDQDIKKFVLRRLVQKANHEPLTAAELKLAIRSAFTATFHEGELDSHLTAMSDAALVAFTKDELEQTLVGLTPEGKIAGERLIKL
jgi:hypothetical protein